MSLFEGREVVCVRGERVVFARISFALDDGQALVLRGTNGSGKSSLLRLMAGLLHPAKGAITWEGASIAADPEAHGARLRYVGHLDAVKPALSVAENLAFWATLARGIAKPGAVGAGLERFGLAHLADIPARMLSAGQRRRLALARLIAAPASLWLLDEPSVSLDAESTAALGETIAEHLREGGLAVIATHGELPVANAADLDLDRAAALDIAEVLQ
jgi:heme exporter protein A